MLQRKCQIELYIVPKYTNIHYRLSRLYNHCRTTVFIGAFIQL